MNDLLTQGLASGSPISFLTQGLIAGVGLFAVECLSIVLNFQLSAMAIAVANPSLKILSTFNNIALDVANVDVLKQSEIILNAIDSYPTA